MKKKIKKILKAIKAWDKKNTTFHSSTYMLLFLASAVTYLNALDQAVESLKAI
jgi:predicted negative regulator of RcsB-dependent stress response